MDHFLLTWKRQRPLSVDNDKSKEEESTTAIRVVRCKRVLTFASAPLHTYLNAVKMFSLERNERAAWRSFECDE
jgi:hypothetical protein